MSTKADHQMHSIADDDPLFSEAVKVVREKKRVSTSLVQRTLRLGYNRASALIERIEKEHLVSAPAIDGRRRIL